MTNDGTRDLCLALMKADTEEEAIVLLKGAGWWDRPGAWRYYGDHENNYSTIGNQQSRPDAALVEKLVNSVDARLMNECMARGIAPSGPGNPKSIKDAVNEFFEEDVRPDSPVAGRMKEWKPAKRTDVSRGITLAATGHRPAVGKPCFTVADAGEGQTPRQVPETLVSLRESNKLRIPFVQGKFNMGGTGALKFCGRSGLQLIVTRRNPRLLTGGDVERSDHCWSFTVVRREDPSEGRRSSVYTYLAPMGCDEAPGKGGVLHFEADGMPILPEGQDAYARTSEFGTLVKLYEYSASGYSNTHMFLRTGIQSRLDILLPDVALPIRLHECRDFRGHKGSFETTLTGLSVRLHDDRNKNLEPGFPSSCPIRAAGEEMLAMVYAFKKGAADTYRRNEGIIFTVNGQTHGHLTRAFFRRTKTVGLSYIADSLLVVVDCSGISGRAREDLFMNSRDRLSGGELRQQIEKCLEELLKQHDGLRELKNRRREEEIRARLDESKPLEEILESLLRHSPALAALFLHGKKIPNPFKPEKTKAQDEQFTGERYPTYFRFKGKAAGLELVRGCHVNQGCRLTFETDAVNDYFSRDIDRGEFSLFLDTGNGLLPVENYVGPNLHNGKATLTIRLPESCAVGDSLRYVAEVMDPSRVDAFVNRVQINVLRETQSKTGGGRPRKSSGRKSGEDEDGPSRIALPNVVPVHEAQWADHEPPFDKHSALRVKHAGQDEPENGSDVYDFYVNLDNVYLRTELKASSTDTALTEARFQYGMVLLGLGLLQENAKGADPPEEKDVSERENDDNIEDKVEFVTRAMAPILLPMIEGLGSLDADAVNTHSAAGEAD